ncbi:MAG TPA: hypothetical protein VGM05_05515 [Planctomycetaceae bacterium]|jgi:DNA-directed RNA polymerase subunit M/transcription elongation factor TFIIS
MTIEFHCPHCDKLLKTPDDKAGVRANCPGCGQTVTVPDLAAEATHTDESFAEVEHQPDSPDSEITSTDDTKPCPMCGAMIKRAAVRCRFCGETLVHRPAAGAWAPTPIDAGDILNRSWEIYKRELGLMIAAILIAFGIPFGINIALSFVQQIAVLAVGGGGPPGGNPNQAVGLVLGLSLVSMVINFSIQTFMQAGLTVFMLRVARGGSPEISDLFSGKQYFWRFFWGSILLNLMIFFGLIFLIVPGVILALMFWPMTYVIADRNVGVLDALQQAKEATSGNYMAVFVLALASFGITLLGLLACGIGLLFSAPLTTLLLAVAYCGMTGQLAERRS